MTLVCTGCRRRFDLIVDTPYTRMVAAHLTTCPTCGGAVQRLSDLIAASGAKVGNTLNVRLPQRFLQVQQELLQATVTGLFNPSPLPPPAPTIPYELTDDDRTFLRVNRIDPEI